MIDWLNRPHDNREDLELLEEEYEYASSLSEDDFYNEYKEEEDMNEYLEFVKNEIKDVRKRIEEDEQYDEDRYDEDEVIATFGSYENFYRQFIRL